MRNFFHTSSRLYGERYVQVDGNHRQNRANDRIVPALVIILPRETIGVHTRNSLSVKASLYTWLYTCSVLWITLRTAALTSIVG